MDPQVLISFFSSRQPRRIKVIENLLRGRETVSTLYWGMRYHLLGYLGTLKSINLRITQRSLIQLVTRDELIELSDNNYLINPHRYRVIKRPPLRRYLGINLRYDLKRFKARFLLATQVVSEYSYRNSNYYPLQIDFQDARLVKYWFHDYKKLNLVTRFYRILRAYFAKLAKDDRTLAWQAVSLLIGHQIPGQTLMQLQQRLKRSVTELKLRQLEILCGLVAFALQNDDQLLVPLLKDLRMTPVSNSALLTFRLCLRHLPLSVIARRRRLKRSTIKEHLLTVAIFSDQRFPYRLFINDNLMNELGRVYHGDIDQWNYDRFRQVTGKSIDFFYFRLYQIMRSKIND